MVRVFRRFLHGVTSSLVGALGVALVNAAFFIFLVVEGLRLVGVLKSAYVGMISYLVLPPVFVLGLLLIPVGWWLHVRRSPHSWRTLLTADFGDELVAPRGSGSRLFALVATLTVVNLAFLGGGSARMLQFMEEPEFCGTACHSVMSPEWATYQDSPHARVRCVECHVGEGAEALIDSKVNGLWQLVSVTFDLYERPIPTPVHQLRPARETCEHCHWPDKVTGDRIKTWERFEMDRESTPTYTTLKLYVGSSEGDGVHWHVGADNQVRYASEDDERRVMLWVEARASDGGWIRYEDPGRIAEPSGDEHVRVMDCVDCHNRVTHIYEGPEDAVDRLIAEGAIDRRIPLPGSSGSCSGPPRRWTRRPSSRSSQSWTPLWKRCNTPTSGTCTSAWRCRGARIRATWDIPTTGQGVCGATMRIWSTPRGRRFRTNVTCATTSWRGTARPRSSSLRIRRKGNRRRRCTGWRR
jgi:hypothetical protein